MTADRDPRTSGKPTPNPGSPEARAAGCWCAVLDNCQGRFPPIPAGTPWGGKDGAWYITVGCPVHHPPEQEARA